MFPLRGLWNRSPAEGDYFITCECDWLVSPPGNCVQFSVSGNSPVALSQIVALAIDNSLSGADVQFVFSDSGFKLTVPAHNQLVAPVFTNGLTFYANAPGAVAGDVTVFQILNSMPPPVPIEPSAIQNHIGVTGINMGAGAGTTPVIPAGVSGTINTLSIVISGNNGNTGAAAYELLLTDGTGATVWTGYGVIPGSSERDDRTDVTGLSLRFQDGLNATPQGTLSAGSVAVVNVYYSTP